MPGKYSITSISGISSFSLRIATISSKEVKNEFGFSPINISNLDFLGSIIRIPLLPLPSLALMHIPLSG